MSDQTITVDATGKREKLPELTTIEATVHGDGQSARDARVTVKDRVATLRQSVETVPTSDIHTTDLRIQQSSEMFDPDFDAPFQAIERLQINCTPTDTQETVIDVTDAGATVQFVSFELQEGEMRELQNQALEDAMERAREKAERMASAEDLTVEGVEDASTAQGSSGMDSIVDEALAANDDTELQPTPVVVSEHVTVTYNVRDSQSGRPD